MDETTATPVTSSTALADSDDFALLRQQLAELQRAAIGRAAIGAEPETITPTADTVTENESAPAPTTPTAQSGWTKFVARLRKLVGLGEDNLNDPLRFIAAVAVATVTGVISYTTLADLGSGMGFGEPGSHLFPIGIDAAVFLFTRAWMNRRLSTKTQTFAKWSALFFTVMSVLGNSIQHGKAAYSAWTSHEVTAAKAHHPWLPGTLSIAWLVATIVFSALMPLALGLSLHVISRITDDVRAITDGAQEQPEKPKPSKASKPAKHRAPKTNKVPADTPKTKQHEPQADASEKPISIEGVFDRPAWVTDDMTPTDAMNRYLDEHGETAGAALEKWVAGLGLTQDFKPGLGRTTLFRWKTKRDRENRGAASGE